MSDLNNRIDIFLPNERGHYIQITKWPSQMCLSYIKYTVHGFIDRDTDRVSVFVKQMSL